MIDLHLHLFIKGRHVGSNLRTHLDVVQLILAHVESTPHIVHHRDGHDGTTRTHQLADLGIDTAHLAVHLGNLNCLANIGIHLLHSTLGAVQLSLCSQFLLLTGTVHCHVILTLGSLHLSLRSLIHRKGLVALLSTHHALVEEALHTVVRLLCNLQAGLSLLQQLESTLHLLLTGTILCHLIQSGSSTLSTLSLLHLSFHLRTVKDGQRIASMYEVAFLHSQFQNTSGHLARHTIFRNLHLSLNQLRIAAQDKEANQCHDNNNSCKAHDGIQDVVMLFFCLITHISFYFLSLSSFLFPLSTFNTAFPATSATPLD